MTDQPEEGSASARWDATRAKKRREPTGPASRRCINCGADSTPRYLYCSDDCAAESLAKNRRTTGAE
ncbi:MAG TPA: hypothetical protein VHT75_04235 [Acidimicrobiales bacterium]|jgi:hypothetical protein|nr:hypothetical protein [Acidimicrobiales bacterium]